MKRKILLCYPVTDDEFLRGSRAFPQFEWIRAEKNDNNALADAEIAYGKPGDALLANARALKWLQATSAGVEALASSPHFLSGKFVLTTAAGMHESCVEHAFALLLGFARRVGQHSRLQDSQRWKSRESVGTPLVLEGRTMGILGMGAIGRRIAEIARVMRIKTIGVNYSGKNVSEADETHAISKLDELLPRFDILMMILPATKETDKLLNAQRIAKLPSHCIVVNVGRGNAVDEPALIAALKENRIAGAALDVFQQEPLPADSPFYNLPNVVMTPHIGGNRPDYDQCAFEIFLDNLKRYERGEPLQNVVEKSRGY